MRTPEGEHIVVHWDGCFETVPSPAALAQLFDENAAGGRAMAYFLGPGNAATRSRLLRSVALRVDLDPDTGAGAARWGSGMVAVEPGYTAASLEVWEAGALVPVAQDVARVSYTNARRLAIAYVATAARPGGVLWAPAPPPTEANASA